jgi:CheY-like chemotaxis protein
MPRTALIVDDSRTALAALSRLLKAQGIGADTVESGPEALDYLRRNAHPGVIFLDHMMPGMDGFETLAAIKRDAATRDVPVVMYTSREGDAYMGQAMVQGAIGVLRKPVNPEELDQVLQRVDRVRVAPATAARATAPAAAPTRPRAATTGVIDVPAELRSAPASSGVARAAPAPATGSTRRPRSLAWLARMALIVALLLPAGWFYQRFQQSDRQRAELSQENTRLQVAARTTAAEIAANEPGPWLQRPETGALLEALAWAVNQHGQYGLNEEPLNDARLSQVRELVTRLTGAGFRGTLRLETHVGEYCLVRDELGGYRQPNDGLAFLRCQVLSYPPAQAVLLGERQSPAFARYLAQQRDAPVQVAVVSHGNSRPLVHYPDMAGVQTAGDWNQAARINQRVEVVLVPAP